MEREERITAFLKAYGHDGPWFGIAAISGDGCRPVVYAIYEALQSMPTATGTLESPPDAGDAAEDDDDDHL